MLIEKYGIENMTKGHWCIARVLQRNSNFYEVVHDKGQTTVQMTGKFKMHAKTLPVVGDFVWLEPSCDGHFYRIAGLLARRSTFSRKPAVSGGRKIRNGRIIGGSTEEQIIAANIDVAFIVTDLCKDFNIMRLERYVTAAKSGGIRPIVVLNKLDLCHSPQPYVDQIMQIDPALTVLPISVLEGTNISSLQTYCVPGETVVFLGSSGVGKSSIMNLLFGYERQQTKAINKGTGKGKHTTTSSELFLHSSGCLLIDTPGLRELNLWCDEDQVASVYNDILDIMEKCRFRDCKHENDMGCAVIEALRSGDLNRAHYESYLKLMGDAHLLTQRKTQKEMFEARINKRKGF